MGVIDDKIDLIARADTQFFGSLKTTDEQLSKEIVKILSRFVVAGDLEINAVELARLEETLIAAVAKTDYKLALNSYLPNYEAVEDLNKLIHEEVNGININNLINENAKIANFNSVVSSQLKGTPSTIIKVTDIVDGQEIVKSIPYRNTSLDELIGPIADVIRKDVITGNSFASATESILEAITKKKLGLEQWASQIAMDALKQSDGITQDEVRKEFNLKFIRYVGTVKNTTRPLCFHLLRSRPKPVYKFDELQKILTPFVPLGIPSKKTVSGSETANTKQQEKGSGIIPGTDAGNFLIRRGGYRCRHDAIPAKRAPAENI